MGLSVAAINTHLSKLRLCIICHCPPCCSEQWRALPTSDWEGQGKQSETMFWVIWKCLGLQCSKTGWRHLSNDAFFAKTVNSRQNFCTHQPAVITHIYFVSYGRNSAGWRGILTRVKTPSDATPCIACCDAIGSFWWRWNCSCTCREGLLVEWRYSPTHS
jgi:hypothetical protein